MERYRIDDLIVDVETVEVRRGEELVDLPPLSFDLLVALARRAPRPVPADELIDAVWDGVAVADETLFQRVSLLRRSLGDDARAPRYVESVRGRGYRARAEPVESGDTSDATSSKRALRPAVIKSAVAVGMLLLVLAAVTFLGVSLGVLPGPAGTGSSSPQPDDAIPAIHTAPAGVDEMLGRADEYVRRHRAEDNELAIDLYRQALERHAGLPRALVGLSLALSQRSTKFNGAIDHARRAEELARQVLALEPVSARGHHALGLALDALGRIGPALAAYRRAYALDPARAEALASAAYLMQVRGDLAAALAANARTAEALAGGADLDLPYLDLQIAVTLDQLRFHAAADVFFERSGTLRPDSVFTASAHARAQLSRGMPARADQIARAALGRGMERPDLWVVRGDVALLAGDQELARRRYDEATHLGRPHGKAEVRALALDLREAPKPDLRARVQALADELRASREAGNGWPGHALDEVVLRTATGDLSRALAALDAAVGLGARDADWLLLDPLLARLRRRPGLAARVEHIRELVERERQRVLADPSVAPLLVPLLSPNDANT